MRTQPVASRKQLTRHTSRHYYFFPWIPQPLCFTLSS